jgi:hypothetical protein
VPAGGAGRGCAEVLGRGDGEHVAERAQGAAQGWGDAGGLAESGVLQEVLELGGDGGGHGGEEAEQPAAGAREALLGELSPGRG